MILIVLLYTCFHTYMQTIYLLFPKRFLPILCFPSFALPLTRFLANHWTLYSVNLPPSFSGLAFSLYLYLSLSSFFLPSFCCGSFVISSRFLSLWFSFIRSRALTSLIIFISSPYGASSLLFSPLSLNPLLTPPSLPFSFPST